MEKDQRPEQLNMRTALTRIAKGLGKLILQKADDLMNDPELPLKLIRENEAQAEAEEQVVLDLYGRYDISQYQEQVTAIVLARSICKKVEIYPQTCVDREVQQLKNLLDELPGEGLDSIGLSSKHKVVLSRYL